ncbi:MAG: winged helix-turn-helix transcriptional regulator [Eubacterium sp.]|nr:winged helix-turn-helix transcriptional regulator [Eubacterium sp.]
MKGEVYSQSTCIVSAVAYQYYVLGKKRTEIAESVGLSPATLSRLLRRAREEGIIEFHITEPYLSCCQMEEELADQFGLKCAIVVPVPEQYREDKERVKKLVALEGARYIQRIINDGDIIGLNWGGTMYHLIQYLNPCRKVPASIITMHGSIEHSVKKFQAKSLVRRAAMSFGGSTLVTAAPGLSTSPEEHEKVLSSPEYQKLQKMYSKIDISVSGVGSIFPEFDSPLVTSDFLNKEELDEVMAQKPACDFLLRFFNEQGEECHTSISDRTVSIPVDVYKKIPTRIVVASGKAKAHAIMSLLNGDLVDVLIIDKDLADAVVDLT